jgi:hypothetical protein
MASSTTNPSSVFSSPLGEWEDFYTCVLQYGFYVALWGFLCAVTIYRREISCNRLYHKDDDDDRTNNVMMVNEDFIDHPNNNSNISDPGSPLSVLLDDEREIETEELLEGAGLYCSGRAIVNFATVASLWTECFGDEETTLSVLENDITTTDLLDRVGNYASGEPIAAAMALFAHNKKRAKNISTEELPLSSAVGSDPFMKELPPDVHVHIVSFLHPRDVVTLSCVCKKYRNVIDDPTNLTCANVWKSLWKRDYSWLIEEWNIGKQAFERSNCTHWKFSKEFYFRFGQSYLNYVLAGCNTYEQCLVGM